MIKAAILTISDKGSRGEREDKSSQVIREVIKEIDAETTLYSIVPDEKELIIEKLQEMKKEVDLILTTGGTGVGPRDVTPEATRSVIEKELPGYGEVMRMEGFKVTPRAIGSRAIAGIAGRCLIINLPGSPKAVEECLRVILPVIPHTIELIKGEVGECARK
ncbi:MAG TPA: MogA/MoaB family molybdenum cofactor biosynthesis protein [Candidatus Hypogeohydataceae bacterium YC38]|nr:MogA/MoaB family molybdenum cofactor biosynthesis protein [Candidatus Brocadiales bacterium]